METDNTRLAREHLAKLTDKKIIITTLQQMEKAEGIEGLCGCLGASIERSNDIVVALNQNKTETHESTFVHELLHRMLDYQSFPKILINDSYATSSIPPQLFPKLQKLRAVFGSVLHHPEIYRRMRITS